MKYLKLTIHTPPIIFILCLAIFALLFSTSCYAKTCYVNTASAGGDGTTNATSGVNAAYKSLFDWEAAEDGIALEAPMTVYCEGTVADITAVTIADWTGNSTDNTITITTTQENRHSGVWSEEKYRLEVANAEVLSFEVSNIKIDGLQVLVSGSSNYQYGIYTGTAGASNIEISNNIVKETNTGDFGLGVYLSTGSGTSIKVWNNIIYDFDGASTVGISVGGSNDNGFVYNNTVYNCTRGIYSGYDDVIAINNIVVANSFSWRGTFAGDSDYNAGSLADVMNTTGSAPANNKYSQTITFVSTSIPNFHLSSNDASAKDQGTDLSSDANLSFTTDIDSDTRPTGSWDIGADE
ncbi:MAG: right-handed parallel beta-helix repeat-containing protein, partial [Candidatus Eremiobacteraeota bacterium]|nr:right-handed parallel beta-helix repeat-containing protein [Candidatus Eremiobacteraeota bacterium]